MRILFAEDEADLNRIVTMKLTDEGYSVDSCKDGTDALDYLLSAEYDAAILDVMMPGLDGFTVLEKARAEGCKVPVLFLTARDSIKDRVRGLDGGADDYLVKPFSFDELMARIRVMTRKRESAKGSQLTLADLVVDLASHEVTRGGKQIDLSAKEFTLLRYMLHNQGIALTREMIEDHVWNLDYEGGTNLVDVHVSHLRKKIDGGFDQKLIHTIRGVGYMLGDKSEEKA